MKTLPEGEGGHLYPYLNGTIDKKTPFLTIKFQ